MAMMRIAESKMTIAETEKKKTRMIAIVSQSGH